MNINVINANGTAIDFETAVYMMDDELRESIHAELSPLHRAGVFRSLRKSPRR